MSIGLSTIKKCLNYGSPTSIVYAKGPAALRSPLDGKKVGPLRTLPALKQHRMLLMGAVAVFAAGLVLALPQNSGAAGGKDGNGDNMIKLKL